MSSNITEREIRSVLARLGRTSDAIAATLANKGICGRRQTVTRCPIANYLKDQFPEVRSIKVRGAWIQVGTGTPLHRTSPALAEFIARFDAGAFPQLAITHERDRA